MALCPHVWGSKMPAGIWLHSRGVAPGLPCPCSVSRWVSWDRGSLFLLECGGTGITLQEVKRQPRVPGDCLAWPSGIFPSGLCCPLSLQGLGICRDTMPPCSGAWRSEEQLGCCCHEGLGSLLSQKPACLALPSGSERTFLLGKGGGEGGSPSSPPPTRRWGPGTSPLFIYLWEVSAKPLALPFPFLDSLVSFFGLENFAN